MTKYYLLIAGLILIAFTGCQGSKTDLNGVPIVTDVEHITDENGDTITTQAFLDKWCPGENKTPVFNPTCVMVKTQRDKEKSSEMYKNNTIPKW
ncbi:hypothetical protein FCL47_22205 [Desulfopila sp. IMCC35006]|uniref:hypothetical protein n=1 Tax=Desulfopila sp. IMCC35006 TaxID=2569542 RepID=UPI0010AD50BD|nr:hypothetical protein [Desulfopila sp. IMCC35006]TKB23474.1 hypothetical protein FCL47_22205 [Desulfopila sp. IMCC35006]